MARYQCARCKKFYYKWRMVCKIEWRCIPKCQDYKVRIYKEICKRCFRQGTSRLKKAYKDKLRPLKGFKTAESLINAWHNMASDNLSIHTK